MSVIPETRHVIDDLDPIVRVYEDANSKELVIDWNQPLQKDNLPTEVTKNIRSGMRPELAVAGTLGSMGVGVETYALIRDPSYATLATTAVFGLVVPVFTGWYRLLKRQHTQRATEEYGGYERNLARQLRVPAAYLDLHPLNVGSEVYESTRQTLEAAFTANDPDSPLIIATTTNGNETLDKFEQAYSATIVDKIDKTSPLAQIVGSDEAIAKLVSREFDFYKQLPPKTISKLNRLTQTELDFRTAQHFLGQIGVGEMIMFRQELFVEYLGSVPFKLEAMLEELTALFSSVHSRAPAVAVARHLSDLCAKFMHVSQRELVFASED